MKTIDNFKLYYHPNQHTRLFLLAFESLEKAEGLIRKGHNGFVKVDRSEVEYPYITINDANPDDKKIELFFCRK